MTYLGVRRGPLGWIKHRTIWSSLSDVLCNFLFSTGVLGSGLEGVYRRDSLEKWLKGNRNMIYSPIIDWYKESERTGEPMLRDPKFWAMVIGILATVMPFVMNVVPKDSTAYMLLGSSLAAIMYIKQQTNIETSTANVEKAKADASAMETRERVALLEFNTRSADISLETIKQRTSEIELRKAVLARSVNTAHNSGYIADVDGAL